MGKDKIKRYRGHFTCDRVNFDRKSKEKMCDKFLSNNVTNSESSSYSTSPVIGSNTTDDVEIQLSDKDVGITEYLNNHTGFQAVVKARYSDFHVHEIDLKNKILRLDDLSVPSLNDFKVHKDITELRASFSELISDVSWAEIERRAQILQNSPGDQSAMEIDVTEFNKVQRTNLHTIFKQKFDKLCSKTHTAVLETDICPNNARKFIQISRAQKKCDRSEWLYPGEFVHFLVYKEHMESSEVANKLASRLRIKSSNVSFCGSKDKRAKTTQKFCVRKIPPKVIAAAANQIKGLKVGNFQFSDKVLKLGQLNGNHFCIALRYVKGEKAIIDEALKQVSQSGFINYFGLQRYGNCISVPTYDVGLAIMKSDYKLACELIMKPREGDNPLMTEIRKKWWVEREASNVLNMFHPNNKCIEKILLEGLAHYGKESYGLALQRISRNSIQLYLHSFQSLIFNRIVSRRLIEFGKKPIIGDLVFKRRYIDDIGLSDEYVAEKMDDYNSDNFDNDNDGLTNNESDDINTESTFKNKVQFLTENDLKDELYTIYDVVYPLPGHDITYPNNVCGEWYKEMLSTYGIEEADLKHKVKQYSTPGTYRYIVTRPTGMTWKFCKHNDSNDELIKSDLDLYMEKINQPISGENQVQNHTENSDENQKKEAEKFDALILEFQLPSSTYATMLLRELLKTESSSKYQANLQKKLIAEAETNTDIHKTE